MHIHKKPGLARVLALAAVLTLVAAACGGDADAPVTTAAAAPQTTAADTPAHHGCGHPRHPRHHRSDGADGAVADCDRCAECFQ